MPPNTRETLMLAAETQLRSKGYAAFSYADLAQDVGIRKASIHHHFPVKEDLGVAVVESYLARVEQTLAHIQTESLATAGRLKSFTRLFTSGLEEGLLPLCGALAAELAALPESLQILARRFLQLQRCWLQRILDEGIERGEVPPGTDTEASAHNILCQMEGMSFVNWTLDKNRKFNPDLLLRIAGITSGPPQKPAPDRI